MLEEAVRKYHNRAIEAAQVIEELIRLARQMREAHRRGEQLGLSDDELAFYDALETNDSAVKILGDDALRAMARDLVGVVRRNTSIDWTVRESVRANLRRLIRRVLKKYGYPPDKQAQATLTVLEQAELSCEQWAGEEEALPISVILVSRQHAQPFVTNLPVYSLAAAAGRFGQGRDVGEEGWVQVNGRRLDDKMFVARVVGHSMEPKIPDGSHCIFRAHPEGTRQGKIVLVQHRGIDDPETGGQFTVKRYTSEKSSNPDGTWQHTKIMLEPMNPAYKPTLIDSSDAEAVTVLAEFLEVLA